MGFQVENFKSGGLNVTAFDMSGQSTYRGLWEAYYQEVQAIIWVLDSSDKLRMELAKEELGLLLGHDDIRGRSPPLPLLIFANKMDLRGSLTPVECMEMLGLQDIQDKPWHITASNAVTGDGIEEAMTWLADALKGAKTAAGSKSHK